MLCYFSAPFWAGSESERRDAGFPEDQTHVMLKFHPRFRDGSSASVICTDPACSTHPASMTKSFLKRSNPRRTGAEPRKCTSPTQMFGKESSSGKDNRHLPTRFSLPFFGIH